jgi:[pyruvate, water dikinase]-phosphate phosphotransferase / [pyruvate, water dikinase] kinase
MPNQVPTLFHLHLIPDATGEWLTTLAKAAAVQYAQVRPIEHVQPLVRTATSVNLAVLHSLRARAIAQGRQCITDEFAHAYQTALRVKATCIAHLLRRGEKVDSDAEIPRPPPTGQHASALFD